MQENFAPDSSSSTLTVFDVELHGYSLRHAQEKKSYRLFMFFSSTSSHTGMPQSEGQADIDKVDSSHVTV